MDAVKRVDQGTVPATILKAPQAVNVAIDEVPPNDTDENYSSTEVNGIVKTQMLTMTNVTIVREKAKLIKTRMIQELDVDRDYFERIDLDAYLEFIAEERLIHMPHKGSGWDRILKAAEYFGLQIDTFANSVSAFVSESKLASETALASCQLLLEVRNKPRLGFSNQALSHLL